MKTMRLAFFHGDGWKHFRRNKAAKLSLYLLTAFTIIALLAPVIANEKPLLVKYNGHIFFPAFSFSDVMVIKNEKTGQEEMIQSGEVDWKHQKTDYAIPAPVPFSPGRSDPSNPDYSPPGTHHLLGTTRNGGDVLSGLIHGMRISLSIGILSMIIASLIGIALGAIAGYFGDRQVRIERGKLWLTIAGLFPACFYGFYVRRNQLTELFIHPGIISIFQLLFSISIFMFVLLVFYSAGNFLKRSAFFARKIFLHADSLVSRTIEVFISIPRLVLIITLAAIARPSFINLIFIIGLTSWTEIARFTRAELLRARNSDYIEVARAMGFSNLRIILKHALPNVMAPATVAIVFGIASAILVESALSFLGIGVPIDTVTWGSLLFAGKENFEAWWLVVFPGLMIFLTVTAFNLLGDGLRDSMDVRSRIR